jgi:hypothetical protein
MASGGPRVPGAGVVRVRPLWTFRPTPGNGRSTRRPGADRGRSRARCARRPAGPAPHRTPPARRTTRSRTPATRRRRRCPACRRARRRPAGPGPAGSTAPRWWSPARPRPPRDGTGISGPSGPGAVAPTPPQRPRPGHRARSCAAAGVPSPAQYGPHLNSDHGCGTIMRASSCTRS